MAKPMTKAQLVSAIADETGGDKKSAGAHLDALVASSPAKCRRAAP